MLSIIPPNMDHTPHMYRHNNNNKSTRRDGHDSSVTRDICDGGINAMVEGSKFKESHILENTKLWNKVERMPRPFSICLAQAFRLTFVLPVSDTCSWQIMPLCQPLQVLFNSYSFFLNNNSRNTSFSSY